MFGLGRNKSPEGTPPPGKAHEAVFGDKAPQIEVEIAEKVPGEEKSTEKEAFDAVLDFLMLINSPDFTLTGKTREELAALRQEAQGALDHLTTHTTEWTKNSQTNQSEESKKSDLAYVERRTESIRQIEAVIGQIDATRPQTD